MYRQINPTEMFRERQLALLREAENRRLARRLRARRTPKVRSTIAATSFLVALVVASLLLVGRSSPAQASTTFTVNSTADFADMVGQTITATATKNSTLDTSEFSAPRGGVVLRTKRTISGKVGAKSPCPPQNKGA